MFKFKKTFIYVITCLYVILYSTPVVANTHLDNRFSDIPQGNWADKAIHQARQLNITQGKGNNVFGYGEPVRRSEFIKFLVSLMGWDLADSDQGSFKDNQNKEKWYYRYIETAVKHGIVIKEDEFFYPNDYITREDMAIMIVRALGYDGLARYLNSQPSTFSDVDKNSGYISLVKDMGVVKGKGDNLFDPTGIAKREEAIVMLMRMYNKLNHPLKELHAFYAISSYSQMYMMEHLDSVSFGWSSLYYDKESKQVLLSLAPDDKNSFYLPESFETPFNFARKKELNTQLMVFASQENSVYDEQTYSNMGLIEYVLSNPILRKKIIEDIVNQVNLTEKNSVKVSFDGVVIDFECMKGEKLKQLFNIFLKELRNKLNDKKLYVAVHPKRRNHSYYDAYDYRTIGEIADKVILMAHDYYNTKLTESEMEIGYNDTPLAPINEVYYALHAITDNSTGVADRSKIWLQLSFDSLQWKKVDGSVINRYAFRPEYVQIYNKLSSHNSDENICINYNEKLHYAWFTYYNTDDKTDNIIWYENTKSVFAKINLAKMFGIHGISLWRLGNIPDYDGTYNLNVWQKILDAAGGK